LKLIQISTDYVFSGLRSIPWSEEDLTIPKSVYGRSKESAEGYIQDIYPENSLIIRTSWLYSRWKNNFAKKMAIKAISEKDEISVVDDQWGQPTCCIDLGEKILEILDRGVKSGKYHVTNSGETNWFEYARKIFKLLGADPNRIKGVKSSEYQTSVVRPTYSVLDNRKLITMGIKPMISWQDSLERELPNIMKAIEAIK
jgi:dTDP-4-dehydrorhamnose reductase